MKKEGEITRIQELVYELRVNQVMTQHVVTVAPETNMSELREILRVNRISGVPVARKDELVGMISLEDFIKWLASGQKDCPIAERMSTQVETVFEDSPLLEAVNRFDRFRFGRLPVLGRKEGKLLGIVTKGDIIQGLLKKVEVEYQEEEIQTYRASHIFEDIVADKAILRFQYGVHGKDFEHAGECASGLKKTLKRLGFHPQVIRRVAIATYEAEMNLIIFAEHGEIVAEVESDRINISVQDTGPGIEDVELAMQVGYSTAPEWVRELGFGAGMGLDNIKNCSDEMSIHSTVGDGTRLEIGISLTP
ncbi:MAG: CBS domain-containing protein [Candidatus Latescibacterota bacterium]